MSSHTQPFDTSQADGRYLRIGSARNLRDVGGYDTIDGRATRWRSLWRSDSLHDLSAADQAILASRGIRTVIDLRSSSEADRAHNRLAQSAVLRYIHVPFGDAPLVAPTPAELYRLALRRRQREFKAVFALLACEGFLPAVVQCSAGRDRTGLVVALVLALVGVSPETIAADYALSVDSSRDTPADVQLMLDTLSYLESEFGGARKYLCTIGLTDRELRAIRGRLVE